MQVKSCVIGHFGKGKTLLNGQTVKTKIITNELEEQLGKEQVIKIDTRGGWKTLLRAPLQVFRALKRSKNVIIFPAQNGLKVYAPLLCFLKKFFKNRKLHYVVIGGWLNEFISTRRKLAKTLKKFDAIYVETLTMKSTLEDMGFSNVFVMPNCKNLTILTKEQLVYSQKEPYKLCTFSRVCRQKGIEEAINAVKNINQFFGRTVFSLDIYGQIEERETDWFINLKKTFPDYIQYAGLVNYDKSVDVLKDYLALLFPTYYDGEGFAGTILDAYSAGVPVIASDWKYNKEIVKDGQTGFIFETKNTEQLALTLRQLIGKDLTEIKNNCLIEAKNYLPSTVIKDLINNL